VWCHSVVALQGPPATQLSRTRYGVLAPASFQYTKTALQRIAALQASWQGFSDRASPAAPVGVVGYGMWRVVCDRIQAPALHCSHFEEA
jgi:hypothetical protein